MRKEQDYEAIQSATLTKAIMFNKYKSNYLAFQQLYKNINAIPLHFNNDIKI